MTPNWVQIYEAARRSRMAYEMDPVVSESLFSSTGLHWLGLFNDNDNQAVACIDNHGTGYLSISGTRISQGKIWDLVDDAWILPKDLGSGIHVTSGAFSGMKEVWDWANSLVTPSTVWNVEGHSLGAWRTRYTPVFLPPSRIGNLHSFESPKGANRAYWQHYKQQLSKMVSVVNGRDVFVNWPFGITEWEHPLLSILWLKAHGFAEIFPYQYPMGVSIADHNISLVESRCKVLAGV